MIEVFNAGLLQLSEEEQQGNKNITLRAYLASKLRCDPMRLTKKFSGSACLGKRVFHFDYLNAHAAAAEAARRELQALEQQHLDKLREIGRKRSRGGDDEDAHRGRVVSTPAIDALMQRRGGAAVPPLPSVPP
ncbi:hypothetical protein EON64_09365, partial [archaeon]